MVCFGCCRPSTSSSAHGGRAIAFVFGLIGLYCSYIVTQSCDFLHYRLLEDNDNRTASVEELPFPFHNVPITADGNGGDDNFGGHVGLYGYRDTTTTSSSSFASEAEKDDNTTTASTKTDGDKEDNKNASSSNKWEDFISVLPWNLDHTVCTRYEKQFFKLVNGGGEDESTNAKDANDSTSDADKDNTKLWFVVGSQLAQVGAIITTFVALLTLLLDWCAYTNCCSYTINWILFLFSCLLQSTTFIIYAQKELCYEDDYTVDSQCDFGIGSIYSMIAAAIYYLAGSLLCYLPRPDPYIMTKYKEKQDEQRNQKVQADFGNIQQP